MNANRASKIEFPRGAAQALEIKRVGREVMASIGRHRHSRSGVRVQFLTYVVARSAECRLSTVDSDTTMVLWIGSVGDAVQASFDLSLDEAAQVAELLEIPMPAQQVAA